MPGYEDTLNLQLLNRCFLICDQYTWHREQHSHPTILVNLDLQVPWNYELELSASSFQWSAGLIFTKECELSQTKGLGFQLFILLINQLVTFAFLRGTIFLCPSAPWSWCGDGERNHQEVHSPENHARDTADLKYKENRSRWQGGLFEKSALIWAFSSKIYWNILQVGRKDYGQNKKERKKQPNKRRPWKNWWCVYVVEGLLLRRKEEILQ